MTFASSVVCITNNMKHLKKCCFCVNLRCGCVVIYAVEFVLSFHAICLGQCKLKSIKVRYIYKNMFIHLYLFLNLIYIGYQGNEFLIVYRLASMGYLICNVFLLMGVIFVRSHMSNFSILLPIYIG